MTGKRRTEYILLPLLFALLAAAPAAQVVPQEIGKPEVEFVDDFFEAEGAAEDFSAQELNTEEARSGWLTAYFRNTRLSLQHELAYRTVSPGKPVTNRASARVEDGRLFGGHYFLKFDGSFNYNVVYEDEDYPRAIRNEYRIQRRWREGFLQASFGPVSITLGKQVIVWGKADGAVVTDVISPRDRTELIYTSLEDSRIGQRMLAVDFYPANNQRLSIVLNPDPRVNLAAPPGHAYVPASAFDELAVQLQSAQHPQMGIEYLESGIRWSGTSGKNDYALMLADVLDNEPVYQAEGYTAELYPRLKLQPQYRRYRMLGGGFNSGSGNIVWKAEAAAFHDKSHSTTDYAINGGIVRKDMIAGAAGFDYNSPGHYQLTLEASNMNIRDWQNSILAERENESLIYGSWAKSFMHETLATEFVMVYQPQDGESLLLPRATYEFNDRWTLRLETALFNTRKENTLLGLLAPTRQTSLRLSGYY